MNTLDFHWKSFEKAAQPPRSASRGLRSHSRERLSRHLTAATASLSFKSPSIKYQMTRIDSNPVFQSEKFGKKVHNNKVPRQKCQHRAWNCFASHGTLGPGGYFFNWINWIKNQNWLLCKHWVCWGCRELHYIHCIAMICWALMSLSCFRELHISKLHCAGHCTAGRDESEGQVEAGSWFAACLAIWEPLNTTGTVFVEILHSAK